MSKGTLFLSRRALLPTLAGAIASVSTTACAQGGNAAFERWVAAFGARARGRGISEATYTQVMSNIKPDTKVFDLIRSQPEFNEQLWQYLNRRVSDWRITTGREKAKEFAPLLERIENDYGVDRWVMLGVWGIESAFGDPDVQKNHMRPVIPALAALAWGEPRRRAYWEQELLNALIIIERGWSTPQEMRGSWAGAMGHTQWMPEVWLNVGLDYDRDGRVTPFGRPDDALAGHRAISRPTRKIPARRALGLRGAWRRRQDRRRSLAQLRSMAESRGDPRRRQGLPAVEGNGEALDSGGAADRLFCSGRISMPCAPTTLP